MLAKLFSNNGNRSSIVKRNILGSGGLKIINITITLLIVPMTINYISAERYGIWLTLSSIIAWMSYFDFGLGHGFRNHFATALAKNDYTLARQLVSTTFITLGIIFSAVFIVAVFANSLINWSDVLKVSQIYKDELSAVFMIVAFCFCCNCVLNSFNILLVASQKSALASLIQTMTQLGGLVGIYIVTQTTNASLLWLAIAYSVVPTVIWCCIVIYSYFCTSYKQYRPSIHWFKRNLIRTIIGLGGKFFIIMLSMLLIFQCINIIISRTVGSIEVTQYNVLYKYLNVPYMSLVLILVPFWSAFTDAYVKNDYIWMKRMLRRLEMVGVLTVIIIILMTLLSKIIIRLWVGDSVEIPVSLLCAMCIYMICVTFAGIYMYLINGIGKVKLQMCIYLIFAIISIPCMVGLGKIWGVVGIIFIPTVVYVAQALIGRIQLQKLMNQTATGIWNK